jgi:hypothetical protein
MGDRRAEPGDVCSDTGDCRTEAGDRYAESGDRYAEPGDRYAEPGDCYAGPGDCWVKVKMAHSPFKPPNPLLPDAPNLTSGRVARRCRVYRSAFHDGVSGHFSRAT